MGRSWAILGHLGAIWGHLETNFGITFFGLEFKKALKAKIRNQTGNQIELIVKAQFAEVVDLSQILQDQTASTCMVVSKNRHPAWILHKNSLSILENSINRIDHLELFRAEESYQDFSLML